MASGEIRASRNPGALRATPIARCCGPVSRAGHRREHRDLLADRQTRFQLSHDTITHSPAAARLRCEQSLTIARQLRSVPGNRLTLHCKAGMLWWENVSDDHDAARGRPRAHPAGAFRHDRRSRARRAAFPGALDPFPRCLYHSFHTTAGYLEQGLASRLTKQCAGDGPYVEVFRQLFPEGAGYEHDQLERRHELTRASARSSRATRIRTSRSSPLVSARACRTSTVRPSRCASSISTACTDGRPRRRLTSIVGFTREAGSGAAAHRRAGVGSPGGFGQPEGSEAAGSTSRSSRW